jgi:hypothetical protein
MTHSRNPVDEKHPSSILTTFDSASNWIFSSEMQDEKQFRLRILTDDGISKQRKAVCAKADLPKHDTCDPDSNETD